MKRYIAAALVVMFMAGAPAISEYGHAAEREEDPAKTFAYEYATCYWKMNDILRAMPHVTVYSESYDTIKLYYIHPNTTGVEVYFTAVDATHTRVEVTSDSSSAKNWIAKNLFSETVKEAESSLVDPYKGDSSKTKDW